MHRREDIALTQRLNRLPSGSAGRQLCQLSGYRTPDIAAAADAPEDAAHPLLLVMPHRLSASGKMSDVFDSMVEQ